MKIIFTNWIYAFLICILVFASSTTIYAQVIIDPNFNPTDVGYGDYLGLKATNSGFVKPGTPIAQAIQADGKIILGAGQNIDGYNGNTTSQPGYFNLIRLNANGTLDTTFNRNGTGVGVGGFVHSIVVQTDGKIIIGGSFTTYNNITVNGICRITSTGSFDPTFNPGLGINGGYQNTPPTVYAISVQNDGKVIIAGIFKTYNSIPAQCIARLNSNGSYDNTFNVNGVVINVDQNHFLRNLAIQPDGKIIISGSFDNTNGYSYTARLNINGSRDSTFTSDPHFGETYALSLRSDGKIWIGGFRLLKLLTSTGATDSSFSPVEGYSMFQGSIYTILPVNNNKLFIGGSFSEFRSISRYGIALINETGTVDTSFNLGQITSENTQYEAAIIKMAKNTDGSIIFSGQFNNLVTRGSVSVTKLTADYIIDGTFNPLTGSNFDIKTFTIQANGKIMIGGDFSGFNKISCNRIARITSNGNIDTTYNPGRGANGSVNGIVIQSSDNKIIAVGGFTKFNGIVTGSIARTDSTGNFDAVFATNTGTGANGEINSVAFQADGKIIIGGNFTIFNGNTANYLARLNTNGTFDNTFDVGSGGFGQIWDIKIQPDGKILIGGDFQFFNNSSVKRIARLNADGTIDNNFSPTSGGADGTVYTIQLALNGSIFVGGNFNSYNGQNNTAKLVKLMPNGEIDNSFTYSNTSGYGVYGISLYSTGKVLISTLVNAGVGGSYTDLNRLKNTGSIDSTFIKISGSVTGSSFSDIATHASKISLLDNDNTILVAGSFTLLKNVGRNRIARLIDLTILPLNLESFTCILQNNNSMLRWYTSTEVNVSHINIQRSTDGNNFTIIGSIAAKGGGDYIFEDVNLPTGITKLYYRLENVDNDGKKTYSKVLMVAFGNNVSKTAITIFPNPVQTTLYAQVTITKAGAAQLRVIDAQGRVVATQKKQLSVGITSVSIPVTYLTVGSYTLEIENADGKQQKRFVKE